MTTAQQIIDRALRPMRDSAQEYFPDAELIEYINEGIEELCTKLRLLSNEANLTVTNGVANLPADLLQARWLKNPDGLEAAWLDPSTFNDYKENAPYWSADSPLAAIWDEQVRVWPVNDGTWQFGYWQLPALLTADTDIFPLARQWERRIVRYVRGQCYYRLGEIDLADREIAVYASGLRPNADTADRNQPGTVTLAMQGNVFDNDPDATHRGL